MILQRSVSAGPSPTTCRGSSRPCIATDAVATWRTARSSTPRKFTDADWRGRGPRKGSRGQGVGAEQGGVPSAVYTWALARMRSGGGPHAAAAEKMLEAAKNGSLGIPSETPEGILADSRRGRGSHPIQTLGAV